MSGVTDGTIGSSTSQGTCALCGLSGPVVQSRNGPWMCPDAQTQECRERWALREGKIGPVSPLRPVSLQHQGSCGTCRSFSPDGAKGGSRGSTFGSCSLLVKPMVSVNDSCGKWSRS